MKKIKLDIDELLGYFEEGSFDVQNFLDIETGEVLTLIDESLSGIDDKELQYKIEVGYNRRYFPIPEQDSYEGYKDMEAFAETVKDKFLQEKLWIALDGKGAFRRFKNVLYDYSEEQKRWFTFQRQRLKQRALEWLTDLGFEIE